MAKYRSRVNWMKWLFLAAIAFVAYKFWPNIKATLAGIFPPKK